MAFENPIIPPDLKRIRIFIWILVGLALVIIARLWYLQIVNGPELLKESEGNRERLIRRPPARGLILDSSGRILASNRYIFVVMVTPYETKRNPGVISHLARILNTTPESLISTIQSQYITPFDPVRVAVNVDLRIRTQIEEQQLALPGVILEAQPIRWYPGGKLAAHVLGSMGEINRRQLKRLRRYGYKPGDYVGQSGLEMVYDRYLRGKDGGQLIEVDAMGRMRRVLKVTPPTQGDSLTLYLNKSVEEAAVNGLRAWAMKGHAGAAVAIDPNTGGVIALASSPSYDPNEFVTGIKPKDWQALITDPLHPLEDRAIDSRYAPGSTFKLVTSTAALQTGTITPNTTVDCRGVYYIKGWAFHDHAVHGLVDFAKALAVSCDVYFYTVGHLLGHRLLNQYARDFGLGLPTGIDLPGEIGGIVPDDAWMQRYEGRPWAPGDTVQYAIGQSSLAVTPLQMANVVATVANGGTVYRPELVHEITRYNASGEPTKVTVIPPVIEHQVPMSPATRAAIVKGMLGVVAPGGTAPGAAIPGLTIAGKTGTAQATRQGHRENNAWFVAFAPVDHPQIAICVFIEGAGYGGDTSAYIARAMFAAYFHIPLNK